MNHIEIGSSETLCDKLKKSRFRAFATKAKKYNLNQQYHNYEKVPTKK